MNMRMMKMIMTHKFPYKWKLADGYPANGVQKHGKKVFTTFACGGGSSMGYKLAGYEVIGANDIDPQMEKVYKANHHPKHYILADIRKLKTIDLPQELFDIDLFDGSPPCSVFSTAGSREKAWGKEKQFREGQAKQTLDDLFFEYIDVVKRLQPKVVVSENVKGMLLGHAKGYVLEIFKRFEDAGYDTQLFLFNSATMGVPQRRERVFFLSRRKDLNLPKINLTFKEPEITFRDVEQVLDKKLNEKQKEPLTDLYAYYWKKAKIGDSVGKYKSVRKIAPYKAMNTINASSKLFHYAESRELTDQECVLCGSFPTDFNFLDVRPHYLIGMSVPPIMMAQVAHEIYNQWLSKIK